MTDPQPSTKNDSDIIDLSLIVTFVRRHSRHLVVAGGVSGVIGVVIALIVPLEFTATATLLPPSASSSEAGMISQLGLISAMGLGGLGSTVDLYPEIAASRDVLLGALNTQVGDSTLFEKFVDETGSDEEGAELIEETLEYARENLSVNVAPLTGAVELSYVSNAPDLSAEFLNEVIRQMDRFLRARVQVESRQESSVLVARLAEELDSLHRAEERLLAFREANRAITLSPSAQMEQARLMRQVEIHNTLYIEFVKQLEVSRIGQYRTAPVLTVLDWAVPPVKKSGPKRSLIVLGAAALGVIGMAAYRKVQDSRQQGASAGSRTPRQRTAEQ